MNAWENLALMVIDVQLGLFTGEIPIYKPDELFKNINYLIDSARASNVQIVFVQHANNRNLIIGTEGYKIHPKIHLEKNDLIFKKTKPSVFIETDLHSFLQSKNINTLVITGTLSNACVRSNCKAAKKLGYNVLLVSDAHSCWGDEKKAKPKIAEINKKLSSDGIVDLIPTNEIDFK